MKISLLLPTRGRRNELERFHQSAFYTAANPMDIEVICYVDNDDHSYDGLELRQTDFVRGERIVLSEMWNKCFEASSGDIIGHMGDDIIFRTIGWDKMVVDAMSKYPDNIAFVYGRDGLSSEDFGTHGFVHRKWVEVSGFFVPPYFSSDYNDTWLNDVAKAIGRHVFIPQMYTEHMHWTNGKGLKDQTHLDRIARHRADRVELIYQQKQPERDENVQKLNEYIRSV